jgi:hypothetical protein
MYNYKLFLITSSVLTVLTDFINNRSCCYSF